MELKFVKMHGLGNDFMVVEWPRDVPEPTPELVRRWSDRRTGVGFDSLLMVDRGTNGAPQASYRVFNADGGEAEQCGNGARCIASLLARAPDSKLEFASTGGIVERPVFP